MMQTDMNLKFYISKFRGRGMRFKLLSYFSVLIIFPIVTLGIVGNMVYVKSIEEETNKHTIQMIEQVKNNVEFNVKDMENIISYISSEPEVIESMSIVNSLDANRVSIETEVRRILSSYTNVHPEIAGILVVNQNGYYLSNEMYKIARDPLTHETWYNKAILNPDKIQLFSKPIGRNITTRFNYGADSVVSVVKAVKDPDTGLCEGVILIDLKLEAIEKIIKGITLGKDGFVYIIDGSGDIVYAPVNKIVYRVKAEWLDAGKSNGTIKKINGSRYQMIFKKSDYTDWKIIGVFSLNETLKEVVNIRYVSVVIGGITLLLAVLAALYFSTSLAKPITKLRSLMKRAEGGDLDIKFESKYDDEIGQLGNSFNNMIEEINKLIQMVYMEQKSKREAELKILREQIKPHFLYNTLDNIQWMAREYKAMDIVEIVNALTNLFRIGLSRGKEHIKIGEELEHVKSYLIIQKARYEDKLRYEINCEEDISNYKMLKILIQPIVENAIYHGIKRIRGEGKIIINVDKIEDKICISVQDNGPGITPENTYKIEEVLKGRRAEDNDIGYGVFNVNERVRLTFGPEYGIKFKSIEGVGTTFEIWHPILEE
jgi:two-component system sensor histidine kinase YesM